MTEMETLFSQILGTGTALMQGGFVVLVVCFFLRRRFEWADNVVSWVGKYAFHIGTLVALGGMVASLIYSEVFQLLPCELCWWQRLFLYPLVLILGLAIWKPDRRSALLGMLFSLGGLAVAVYHVVLQFGTTLPIVCDIGSVDCSVINFQIFGYITFPVMSATAFGVVAVSMAMYWVVHDRTWWERICAFCKRAR